jgi:hypothetical protein
VNGGKYKPVAKKVRPQNKPMPQDLVEARSEQLLRRESLIEKAAKRLKVSRAKSVRYWDQRCASRLRDALRKGDLVLLYNRSLESQWGKLFSNR